MGNVKYPAQQSFRKQSHMTTMDLLSTPNFQEMDKISSARTMGFDVELLWGGKS